MTSLGRQLGRNNAEIFLVVIAFVLVNLLSHSLQEPEPVSTRGAPLWDQKYYLEVAEQFSQGQLPQSKAPFAYRIGTPLLVSLLFNDDLLFGFEVVNFVGNLLTVILFAYWLRLYLHNWKIRVILVLLFLTQWHGPIRYIYWDVLMVDHWLFVFLLAGLIGIHKLRETPTLPIIFYLGLITFLGVVFREAVLLIAIATLFAQNPLVIQEHLFSKLVSLRVSEVIKPPPVMFFFPLALGLVGLLFVQSIVLPTNDYSFSEKALGWAYAKPLWSYLHGYFITYGPIITIVVYNWRRVVGYLLKNQYMLVYLFGVAVLGWIGGSDTERFLFWAMPVVYLLIGKSIEDHLQLLKSFPLIVILVLSQLISQRLFWSIPEYPNDFSTPIPILTVLTSRAQYLDLWSHINGNRLIQGISFLEYTLLCILLLWWLSYRSSQRQLDEQATVSKG